MAIQRLGRVLATSTLFTLAASLGHAQAPRYSTAHRNAERVLPQALSGGSSKLRKALGNGAAPLSIATADFDEDGTRDLVTGYSTTTGGALLLQRGSSVALSPTLRETALLEAGQTVVPYAATAEPFELPVRPDLIAAADLRGAGHSDLLTAQKGGSSFYLLAGDGRGAFAPARAISLSGGISSLSTWRAPSGENLVVAGVCARGACGLQFVAADGTTRGFVRTAAGPVSTIQTGNINNGSHADLAVIAGGKVLVLDGDSALSASPQLEPLPVAGAAALALGSFTYDRNPGLQLAVLGTDAVLHVFTRAGVSNSVPTAEERRAYPRHDSSSRPVALTAKRNGLAWQEVENIPSVGPGGTSPLLLHGRLGGGGGDDLAIIAGTEYIQVAHPRQAVDGFYRTTPVVTVDATAEPVTAALATRVSADARYGVVTLSAGLHPLAFTPPTTNRTMTVNTTADDATSAAALQVEMTNCRNKAANCTLRAAITVANADYNGTSSADVININSGTYAISSSAYNINSAGTFSTTDASGSVNHHFEVDSSVSLIGTSGCTMASATLTAPSTPTSCGVTIDAKGLDVPLMFNNGAYGATSVSSLTQDAVDIYMTGIAITGGVNPNVSGSGACSANACAYGGGAIAVLFETNNNFALTNVLFTGNQSPNGDGGAVQAATDGGFLSPNPLEFDNCAFMTNASVSANGASARKGGAIAATGGVPLTVNNSYFYKNQADSGGAINDTQRSDINGNLNIVGSLFTSNVSTTYPGGGIQQVGSMALVGSRFVSNSAVGFGGGAYLTSGTFSNVTTASTFLSNSVSNPGGTGRTYNSNGGGLCVESATATGQSAYTVQYSRFYGNTAPVGATGLGAGCSNANSGQAAYVNVNAANNWWGCNGPASGTGCDTSFLGNTNSTAAAPTLTLSPYTTLTLALNTTSPSPSTNLVATASLGQNSAGTVYSGSTNSPGLTSGPASTNIVTGNDTAYLATPITAFTTTLTNSNSYNPSATAFSATASAASGAAATDTASVSSTGGGTATVTVDGATVTRNYTVVAPDLSITSTHNPSNFKAGDTGDTYTLTVGNVGTATTNATVTVQDTLPTGFTVTNASGTGWTCNTTSNPISCTNSSAVAASVTFPAITVTVSVASTNAGTYSNQVSVSGGGEINTSNDTATDPTIVVGPPTLAETFSPSTIAPNATSTVTYTLGNPSANSVSLTGVAFSDPLPSGVTIVTAATTTCSGGNATGAAGGNTISLSGATLAAGATCTVTAGVSSPTIGSYPDSTGNATATNSNAGGMGSATLTVSVTPTKAAFTSAPASPITAGGNAGSISVALEDASGNIATNNSTASVALAVTGPSGYSQTYNATVSNGVATFNLSSVTLTVAGSYTYTASASGLTNGVSTETVNAGALAALSGSGPASFSAPGQPGSITVKAVDSYGNAISSFTGTVTFTSNDPLATLPASYTYTASDAGSHTFTYSFGTAGTARTLTATSGSLTDAQTGIVVNDCILFINSNGSFSRLTDAGVATSPAAGYTGGGAPTSDIAIDALGDVWSVNPSTGVLAEFSKAGVALSGSGFTGGGLNAPKAVAIDGLGYVWVVNANNTVSVFTNAGAPVSSVAQPVTGGSGVSDIAIDLSGNLWIAGGTSNTITEIIGGAAPAPPLAIGVNNATTGTRP